MTSARRKTATASLPLLGLFLLFLCIFPALASVAQPPEPAASPDDELICHTSNPEECYPKIFKPTDEFQTIHDDQEVPKGLHIRMNMTSGKLEAKINVEGELPKELESSGEAVKDQAVLVVEPDQHEQPQIPKGAPEYEAVGKIKEPENDAAFFHTALQRVKGGGARTAEELDKALESLEDISHDIYYGLKITEDPEALSSLFCRMVTDGGEVPEGATPRDQQAAAILAGALSNNPTALKEVSQIWPGLKASICGNGEAMRDLIYKSFVDVEEGDGPAEAKVAAAKAKARVAAINGLIKSAFIRQDFLGHNGMSLLLEVLVPQGEEWAAAQRKTGQLVLDNFLDEDMGAVLGQWPRVEALSDAECQTPGKQAEEGCWDYHVARIAKANRGNKGHWSRDLHDRLTALRKNKEEPRKHEEL